MAEVLLDAHLEGHGTGGATDASPLEPYLYDTIWGDVHELDVAAVRLDGGADELDDLGDTVSRFAGEGCHIGGSIGERGSRIAPRARDRGLDCSP